MLKLNSEQLKALEHGEGPLLIIAGPGSGKTRVITQRIVHLLEGVPGLRPEEILALTFTDKAAEEMKRRIREALPNLSRSPHISTFHAFCYHVLRERHFERRLLDKIDVWIFLRRRMAELELEFYQKLAEPGAFLHDLNEFFSRCQDELIEPDDFEAYVEQVEKDFVQRAVMLDPAEQKVEQEEVRKKKELARVFRNSRKLIEEAGCSSLGSLISETVMLWDREPEVLERTRTRFRYVLVDEFQDSNFAQVKLLKRLVAFPHNITAVGDDDQAIYRFRGASHGAFQMFDEAFSGHATVYLDHNYRSTKKILRSADVVIAKNDRYEKKKALRTENPEGPNVCLLESPDYRSEAAWVADEVERLARRGKSLASLPGGSPRHGQWRHKAAATSGETCFGDIAVLYRAHNYRDLLVAEFRRRKIPFSIQGLSILSTVILRDLVAYLNLVHSPHHNVSLTRVLLAPWWQFPEDLALTIRRQASKDRSSIFSALEATEQTLFKGELERTGWPELKKLVKDLNKFSKSASMTSLFDQLIARLGLVFLPGDPEQIYVDTFRKFLEGWEEKSETRKLPEFMEYFQYFVEAGGTIEAPEPENPSNAVQMMTVHAAKGLEFPVVFVLSVARQRFPHREERPLIEFPDELRKGPPSPANIHLQEERRLFYVAMTRAQERLYVSSVAKSGKQPSVFVDDLLSDPVVAARDIERIQVREVPPAGALCTPLARSEPASQEKAQRSLFGQGRDSGWVHPNLADWANRPPVLGPVGPDEKLSLSATAIEDYRDCPLKFKFSHHLRIPTGPQPALTFGNIMHRSVRYYFELRKKSWARFEDIQEFYLRSWKDAGFEDSYQEQAYKKAGLDQLRDFVERQEAITIPAEKIQMEEHFRLDLGDVVLEGRIDQINLVGPGGPLDDRSVELIDYKTGRPRSQKDADKSLQLSVYALAARRVLKMDPARLTFYNLTNNQPVSTVRTAKDLDEAVEEIREVAAKIRRLLFHPTPGLVCKWCDFVPICPAHEEE